MRRHTARTASTSEGLTRAERVHPAQHAAPRARLRQPYATLTVNLCDARNQNASYAYVDANNLPAAPAFLVENGLASFTGACGTGGFCTYPLFAFTGELFAACADDAEEVR